MVLPKIFGEENIIMCFMLLETWNGIGPTFLIYN